MTPSTERLRPRSPCWQAKILSPGEYRVRPVITIEGHGGFENNLVEEGKPEHYAIDGLFGVVFEWGLENGGSFAIEAAVGPAFVWGEAEHFYGLVHEQDEEDEHHDEEEDEDHAEEEHEEGHIAVEPPTGVRMSKALCRCAMSPTKSWPSQLSGSPTT